MTRGLGSSYLELKVDPANCPPRPGTPMIFLLFPKDGMPLRLDRHDQRVLPRREPGETRRGWSDDIRAFVGNANRIIGDPNNQGNFKTTLANLSKTTDAFPSTVDQAIAMMKDAQKTMEEFRRLAMTGGETLKNADVEAERLVASMVATSNEIGKTVAQLRLAMEKVNNGQGSAGRLINDGRLYESLLENTTQLNVLLKDLKDADRQGQRKRPPLDLSVAYVVLVAGSAQGRVHPGSADPRLDVATRARWDRVGGDQVKARPDIPGGRPHRFPVHLSVAAPAIRSERGGVRVVVAPAATPRNISLDQAPILCSAGRRPGHGPPPGDTPFLSHGRRRRSSARHCTPDPDGIGCNSPETSGAPRPDPTAGPNDTSAHPHGNWDNQGADRKKPSHGKPYVPPSTFHGSPGKTQTQFEQRRVRMVAAEVRSVAQDAPVAGNAAVEADEVVR